MGLIIGSAIRLRTTIFSLILAALVFVGLGGGHSAQALSAEKKQTLSEIHQQYQHNTADRLSESASLNEVLRYGAMRSPALKSAFYRWRASVSGIGQAKAWDDPQFGFKTFIEEVETRVGPQQEIFSVSQKIPFPGKRFTAGKAAEAGSRQARAAYEKAKLKLFYEVKDAYFDYWFLSKKLRVLEKNIELMKGFERVAQSKYKSNQATNYDLLRAQIELGKLENLKLTLEDQRISIAARLNAVINRPSRSSLAWPNNIDHRVVDLSFDSLVAAFSGNNPDLEQASQQINQNRKNVLLAKLDYFPDVTVGFDYINVDPGPLAVSGNGDDAAALMFKVDVPLWLGKQADQVREARSMEIAAQADREQLEADLIARMERVLFSLRDAERQIKLFRDALVPKAEQSLEASETGYSSGNISFLDLIDSERTLLQFQLDYYGAIRDYEQQLAYLEMIVGQPLRGQTHAE